MRSTTRRTTRRNPDDRELFVEPKAPPRIARIVSVRDTRTYVEGPPGVWTVDPASGEWRECPRCHQRHVVHATVLLDNGRTEILGKECARRDSPSMAKQVDTAFTAQASEDKLLRSIASLTRRVQAWERAQRVVEAMAMPPIETLGYLRHPPGTEPLKRRDVAGALWDLWPSDNRDLGNWIVGLRCDDVYLAVRADAGPQYVRREMEKLWREARILEVSRLDSMMTGYALAGNLRDAEKKLARLRAKRSKE